MFGGAGLAWWVGGMTGGRDPPGEIEIEFNDFKQKLGCFSTTNGFIRSYVLFD